MLIYVLQWRPSWISYRHKKQKLCRGPSNDHSWAVCQTVHECSLDVPLQNLGFCSGMKFKMAAMAGLSLTLDPMGKMFQNASSLKPLG
jgi:hypothetical protein